MTPPECLYPPLTLWCSEINQSKRNLSKHNLRMSPTVAPLWLCEVKFGAKILPADSPLDIKVKQQLQSGENASLYVIGPSEKFQYDCNVAELIRHFRNNYSFYAGCLKIFSEIRGTLHC